MPAVKKNITIEKGATFTLNLTWKDAKGRPINLTGHSAFMEIRNEPGGTSLLSLTTVNGKIVLGGALGTIVVTIEDQDTAALTFASGSYTLKLTAPDSSSKRLMQGSVTVSPE